MISLNVRMIFILVILFLCFMTCCSWDFSQSTLEKYCNLSCGDAEPVMCRRMKEKCQLANSCPDQTKVFHITMEEKHLITHMHNRLRNQMALGLYNDLIATDMLEITWNDELEDLAVCWANACQIKFDTCVKTLASETVGQNLAMLNETHLRRGRTVALQVGIEMWFNEISAAHLGADEIDSYNENTTRISKSFTQAIWAKTRFIGCGRVFLESFENEQSLLVCNYLPAGNIPGEKVYIRGEESCSQCPVIDEHEGGCDTKVWTSLCQSAYFEKGSYERSNKGTRSGFKNSFIYIHNVIVGNLLYAQMLAQ